MPMLSKNRPPKKPSVTPAEAGQTLQKPLPAGSVVARQSKANDSGRGTATTVNTTSSSRGSGKNYQPVATRKPITPGPASKKRKTEEREPDPPSPTPSPTPPSPKAKKKDGEKENEPVTLFDSEASDQELFSTEDDRPSNMPGTGSTIVPSAVDSEATPSRQAPLKTSNRKARIESSSEDEEVDVDTINRNEDESEEEPLSPLVGKRPRRPSSRLSSNRSESGRREHSTGASMTASESVLSEYNFNPNDPDWMQFKTSVMENPESVSFVLIPLYSYV